MQICEKNVQHCFSIEPFDYFSFFSIQLRLLSRRLVIRAGINAMCSLGENLLKKSREYFSVHARKLYIVIIFIIVLISYRICLLLTSTSLFRQDAAFHFFQLFLALSLSLNLNLAVILNRLRIKMDSFEFT